MATEGTARALLKPLLLCDLRTAARARGVSPAGSRETLTDTLVADMVATSDLWVERGGGSRGGAARHARARAPCRAISTPPPTLRPPPTSSLTAPGGPPPPSEGEAGDHAAAPRDAPPSPPSNNYSRPQGQNVGNYMTGRPTSRVLAPPGGASQISFG